MRRDRMKRDGGIVRVVNVIHTVDEETCRDCLINRRIERSAILREVKMK